MARIDGIESRESNRDVDRVDPTVVLLGASNLTRGISTVVETSRISVGRPLRVMTALGHGRSYGQAASVLGRCLPGIVECQLWPAIRQQPPQNLFALLTDIGNDILYHTPVATIVAWVEICLQRLSQLDARIVMTQLPISNLESLSASRFRFFRRLFFPSCRYSLGEVSNLARELNERITHIGILYGAKMVALDPRWYGRDPIHLRMRHWQSAWRTIVKSWRGAEEEVPLARRSMRRWVYLRTRRPDFQNIFGVSMRSSQPSGQLEDGTTVALY
ncbi:MAG: hypothetical protein VB876_02130 [Pirellulales bacterium]